MGIKFKPLNKQEYECCLLTWGGIPMTKNWAQQDVDWIRSSALFKQKYQELFGGAK